MSNNLILFQSDILGSTYIFIFQVINIIWSYFMILLLF